MNVLGRYQATLINGKCAINPVRFVTSNWQPLCQMAELEPPPNLLVFEIAKPIPGKLKTVAMYLDFRKNSVVINKANLETECYTIEFSEGNMMGFLWGISSSMIRASLIQRGIIPESDWLNESTLTSLGWIPEIMKQIVDSAACPTDTPIFRMRFDALAVQTAVQCYCQGLAPEVKLDERRMRAMLRAKKGSIDQEAFKLHYR